MLNRLGALAGGAPDPRLGPDANAAANRQGLQTAGLATIMASGPGGMTPFQAIAAGLMQGQQAGAQHRESAFRTRNQEEMAAMLQANGGQMSTEVMKNMFAQAIKTGDVETAKAFSAILPAMIASEGRTPAIYRESRVRDPNNPDRYLGVMINQNDPTDRYEIGEVAPPSSGVTINTGAKQEGQISQYWGNKYGELLDQGMAARGELVQLSEMAQHLSQPGVYQGAGGNFVNSLKKVGQAFGVDVEGVAPAEAARAIGNQAALRLRNPAGGAGMPGALSDKDREFLVSMVPGLENTLEGNRLLIEAAARVAQRQHEVAQAVIEYTRRNGQLDDGFYDYLEQKFGSVDSMADLQARYDAGVADGTIVPPGQVSFRHLEPS